MTAIGSCRRHDSVVGRSRPVSLGAEHHRRLYAWRSGNRLNLSCCLLREDVFVLPALTRFPDGTRPSEGDCRLFGSAAPAKAMAFNMRSQFATSVPDAALFQGVDDCLVAVDSV